MQLAVRPAVSAAFRTAAAPAARRATRAACALFCQRRCKLPSCDRPVIPHRVRIQAVQLQHRPCGLVAAAACQPGCGRERTRLVCAGDGCAAVIVENAGIQTYRKDLEIGLFLIGRIKLIYLALFTFVIDLLAITSTNAGGHIAHIGGALFGIWFAARIKEGKDLTAPMNRLLDWVVNLGKRKPKMRVTYKRPETDYEYNARKHRETVDLDAILDKLKRSGYESLSAEEKKKLFDASKK